MVARLLLLALASRTAAWSGNNGETCAFPTIEYLAIDQGPGISATSAAGGLGADVYVGGYMSGTLDVYTYDGSTPQSSPNPVSTLPSNWMSLHVTKLDTEGRNTKSWLFNMSHPFPSSALQNNFDSIHRTHDGIHLAVGFHFIGTITPPGLPTLVNPHAADSVGCVCKLDVTADIPKWCTLIGETTGRGGGVSGVDGDPAGNLMAAVRTCVVGPTDLNNDGRNDTLCYHHLQRRAAADGALLWNKDMPGSISDIRVDPGTGHIYAIITFRGTIDLGDGFVVTSAVGGAESSGLVIKLTADGTPVWARKVGNSVGDLDLSADGEVLAVLASDADGYVVARLEVATGTVTWLNTGLPFLRGIEVTGRAGPKYVLVYGQTTGDSSTATLIDHTGSSVTLRSRGSYDLFVIKFDQEGRGMWAVDGGGDGMEYFWGMAMDADDNVYISGYSRSTTLTFGAVSVSNPSASANGGDGRNRLYTIKLSGDEQQPSCLSSCDLSILPTTGCYIDHHCVEEGALAPYATMGCFECNSAVDPWDWSGPNFDSHCYIGGKCLSDGDPKLVAIPSSRGGIRYTPSDCEICNISHSKTEYTVKPAYELVNGVCSVISPSPAPPMPTPPTPPPPTTSPSPAPPPPTDTDSGVSTGAVVGIAIGCAVAGMLIGVLLLWVFVKNRPASPLPASKARTRDAAMEAAGSEPL